MTRKDIAKAAAFGTPSEWRDTCYEALRQGYTLKEVDRILFLAHPAMWVWAIMSLVAAGLCWIGG